MKSALALVALVTASASPPPAPTCQPAPIVVQAPGVALNSTFVSDGEPPMRFRHLPTHAVIVAFGQTEIDALCGVPPCQKIFLGCIRGDQMALPDPYTTDSETFARVVRHELSHVNGWPASHGD